MLSHKQEKLDEKTLLNRIPNEIPQDIRRFVSAENIYDSSCSPEAKVYFIDKGNGYYLKCSGKEMLEKEYKMTDYFSPKEIGARVNKNSDLCEKEEIRLSVSACWNTHHWIVSVPGKVK